MGDTTGQDAVAHAFRLAQARRLLRFCRDHGLDERAVIAGQLVPNLSSICDDEGRILPEGPDLAAFRTT